MYTPTMVQKIGEDYFIIDCWHHRILFSKNLEEPIYMWNTLTDDIRGGHTIASDGELYLCDDTDYNAIRVFKKNGDSFKQTQIIGGIETRPHFVIYDKVSSNFFVISSLGGILWIIKNDGGQAKIERKVEIAEIKETYVRSFSLIDGFFYFISGNGFIWKVMLDESAYSVLEKFAVPFELSGMNQIVKIGEYFYITVYQDGSGTIVPNFVRIKDLDKLVGGEYEKLYESFGFKGTPYYITQFDERYFVTEIDGASGIKSFTTQGDNIENIRTHFFFDGHTDKDEKRKMEKY